MSPIFESVLEVLTRLDSVDVLATAALTRDASKSI